MKQEQLEARYLGCPISERTDSSVGREDFKLLEKLFIDLRYPEFLAHQAWIN